MVVTVDTQESQGLFRTCSCSTRAVRGFCTPPIFLKNNTTAPSYHASHDTMSQFFCVSDFVSLPNLDHSGIATGHICCIWLVLRDEPHTFMEGGADRAARFVKIARRVHSRNAPGSHMWNARRDSASQHPILHEGVLSTQYSRFIAVVENYFCCERSPRSTVIGCRGHHQLLSNMSETFWGSSLGI